MARYRKEEMYSANGLFVEYKYDKKNSLTEKGVFYRDRRFGCWLGLLDKKGNHLEISYWLDNKQISIENEEGDCYIWNKVIAYYRMPPKREPL